MDDIYAILAKHFSKNPNSEEEYHVKEFKKGNPVEFEMLHRLWQKGKVEVHDFNTKKAWKKLMSKTRRTTNIAHKFSDIRKIAAVVAILILCSAALYYFTKSYWQEELIVQKNETEYSIDIRLSDESEIWLSTGAELTYPSQFYGKSRKVTFSGTAFFNIERDKAHPFVISTSNAQITVLGTSFNIKSSQNTTEIIVKTGVVEVMSSINNKKIIVEQKQTAVVSKNSIISFETKNSNYLAWKTAVFEFYNTPIEQVVKDLSTYYYNKIELDTNQTFNCNLTARFENVELAEILQVIETTCDLSIVEVNNKYRIR